MATDQNPQLKQTYLVFTGSTPEDDAKEIYRKRYDSDPAEILAHHQLLFLGPVPKLND